MIPRLLLATCVFITCTAATLAQKQETLRAKAGEDISKLISPTGVYRFPAFTAGTYLKTNGTVSSAKLNFNLFTREMQYLYYNGDTMTIANAAEINLIRIKDVLFYYRDGFKEVIGDQDSVKLAMDVDYKLNYEKIGLFDQPTNTTDVVNVTSYNTQNNVFQLTLAQDAVIKKRTTYYLFHKQDSPVIASKKNFLKLFAGRKAAVSKYIDDNKVNFDQPEDLKKLLAFCCS